MSSLLLLSTARHRYLSLTTKILVCEIELRPAENKTGFDLLDDKDFTIPFVNDTIINSPAGYQLLTQAKKMCGS